jgi:hypothetical protein
MINKAAAIAATRIARKAASSEKVNAHRALKSFADMTKDMWETIIDIIPKMIRLTVELIKSPKVSDRAKLILIGGICVAGFVIADEFLGKFTVAPIVFILLGPFSALIALLFFGVIKILLLAITFFVIAKVFVDLIESKEVERLAKELFGDVESKEFLSRTKAIYRKLNRCLEPFAERFMSAFESIGKRKKKGFDPDSAGDIVIRATIANQTKLLEWSGTVKSEIVPLLKEKGESA